MNYDFIRGRIAENRTSQKEIALKMGIAQQSLSRKLNGKRPFTVEEATKLSDLLGIPLGKRAEIFLERTSHYCNEQILDLPQDSTETEMKQ